MAKADWNAGFCCDVPELIWARKNGDVKCELTASGSHALLREDVTSDVQSAAHGCERAPKYAGYDTDGQGSDLDAKET